MSAHSYVQLAETYRRLYSLDYLSASEALRKINPVLSTAIELNPNLDSVQVICGDVKMHLEWDFEEAEKHFLRALSLNPSCVVACYRITELLLFKRRFSEALANLSKLIFLDPFSIPNYIRIGRVFYFLGHYESCLTYLDDALELEPNLFEALLIRGVALIELERYEEALLFLEKSLESGPNLESISMMGYLFACKGDRAKALEIVDQIGKFPHHPDSKHPKLAMIYFALGEKEKAYALLSEAVRQYSTDLIAINVDPRWNRVRHEDRFSEIACKVSCKSGYSVKSESAKKAGA